MNLVRRIGTNGRGQVGARRIGLIADSHVRVARRGLEAEAGAVLPKPHYDYRIDFFRGLSLIFIFINHIPDNAFSYLTSRTYALFDSAEVFMFLAGYSAALAYYSLVPQGLQAFSLKALRRARAIWTYHLLLVAGLMTAAFIIGERALRPITRSSSTRLRAIRCRCCLALLCSPSRRPFSTFFRCT